MALVTGLEAGRDVDRHGELQALRRVQPAVVLHEDGRAVIGAKRLPDVKRSRALRAQDRPVRGRSSQQFPGQPVPLDFDAGELKDHSRAGWPAPTSIGGLS